MQQEIAGLEPKANFQTVIEEAIVHKLFSSTQILNIGN